DKGNNDPNIEKLIELRFQKAMAEEKKKSAALNRELEKMKKEKMTADELKKYEDEQRNTQLAEREKAITEKENRYYAVGAIKKAGLDDGSDTALKIVDLVMAEDTKGIDGKVSALNELVNKLVDAKVDAKFKAAGRSPNGGAGGSGEGAKDKNSLAEKLGKQRAEQAKKSNEILKHYL
ncbi:MAG: DUF4355 domain-containing protein, partial [Clostridiales bacterium]|nr:DUF4355 domain-containing protein [Clostridiales bacterium]